MVPRKMRRECLLGTMKLPLDTNIPRFESLLFQLFYYERRESLLEGLVNRSPLLLPACPHGVRKKLLRGRSEKRSLVVMDVAR
ncbi:hypothetical protein LOK49_LG01G03607 [Camellia lanceoleosa]|uniref:Uncharacterized protein n=1 Tax=Camellia lanceoleosa TaxID=1840588 RepID=A0ACC0J646_9ERIC|nr:hypothetical protein LOK49_LG01G03607 [Camellia lanceoleosa]